MTAPSKRMAGGAPSEEPTGPALRGHVSETGRLSLPAELRRAVGLERGGPVRFELVDGTIRIRTMTELRKRIRSLAHESGLAEKASVDDFLGWREDERAGEAGKTSGR